MLCPPLKMNTLNAACFNNTREAKDTQVRKVNVGSHQGDGVESPSKTPVSYEAKQEVTQQWSSKMDSLCLFFFSSLITAHLLSDPRVIAWASVLSPWQQTS